MQFSASIKFLVFPMPVSFGGSEDLLMSVGRLPIPFQLFLVCFIKLKHVTCI